MSKKILSILIFIFLTIITSQTFAIIIEDKSWDDKINEQEDKEYTETYNKINNQFKLNKFKSNQDLDMFLQKHFLNSILEQCNYQPPYMLYSDEFYSEGIMVKSMNTIDTAMPVMESDTFSNSIQKKSVKLRKSEISFSETNTQKKSVDEPAIVKNTKGNIFYFNKEKKKIYILKSPITDINTIDISKVEILSTIKVPKLLQNNIKMFATDNRLVILGTRNRKNFYNYGNTKTDIIVYDTTNVKKLKLIKLFEGNGDYSKSRLIDDNLYVISNYNLYSFKNEICNKYIRNPLKKEIHKIENNKELKFEEKSKQIKLLFDELKTDKLKETIFNELKKGSFQRSIDISYNPKSKFTFRGKKLPFDIELKAPGIDRLYYIPNDFNNNRGFNNKFNIISTLNINDVKKDIKQSVIWGNISNGEIHMTTDNLYLVNKEYNYNNGIGIMRKMLGGSRSGINTLIHKLKIDGLNLDYVDSTILSGEPINQYSMDEDDKGNFRIFLAQNYGKKDVNLFVLDEKLKLISRLKDIEPKEQFKSSRFIGDKAYLVTFKATDPLFVIDMKDYNNLKVVGELKIPGYSLYLHPYGSEKDGIQYLIGVGQEAEEVHGNRSLPKNVKIDLYKIDYNKTIGQHCIELKGEKRKECLEKANIKVTSIDNYNCECPVGAQCLIDCKDPIELQNEEILASKNAKNIYVNQEFSYILGGEKKVGGNTSYTPVFDNPRSFVFDKNKKELTLPLYLVSEYKKPSINNEIIEVLDGDNIDTDGDINILPIPEPIAPPIDDDNIRYYENQKIPYFIGMKTLKIDEKDGIYELKSKNYIKKLRNILKSENKDEYRYSFNSNYMFKKLDFRTGTYGDSYYIINNKFIDFINNKNQNKYIEFN